jgi:signal transduction histidine kinase/CheY-like chemotaxis protein
MTNGHKGAMPLARWGWVPIPLLLLVMLGLWAADLRASYVAPPGVLFALQFLFMTVASALVAYLISRSFVASGSVGLLLLACGAMCWGFAGIVAGAVSRGDFNVSVTTHNLCVWISAFCHLIGVVLSGPPQHTLRERGWWLFAGFALTSATVAAVAFSAVSGITPTFFVQGEGGTAARQVVLGSAIAMFVITALVLLGRTRLESSRFTRWYCWALLLIGTGLFGVLIQSVHSSALGWTGVGAQLLGGVYLLIAAFAAARESRASDISLAVPPRDARLRYCLAVAFVVAAVVVKLVFLPDAGVKLPYLMLYPAVILAALYGGRAPGLLAAVLAVVAIDVFWIEPIGQFGGADPYDWLGMGLFLGISAAIIFIIEAMQRASAGISAAEAELKIAAERDQAGKEADRRKDEFLATLAHELRNPLAPLRNAAYILRDSRRSEPELKWSRDVIERQVRHMARLLDDLLDVSRITSGKLELRKEPCSLVAVVESARETSQPSIHDGGHELTVELPSEPVYLEADPVRLSQVLSNLLNNAARYTPAGGRIRLRAATRGRELTVTIADNGVGISGDMLPLVFDMFSQGNPRLARSAGGLGIGLALARGLVEAHGGTIEARSEGAGKGSEFIVRLPIVTDAVAATSRAPAAEDDSGALPRRILVVDDVEENAVSLAAVLRGIGHEVHTAYGGEEAVAATARLMPDVVLLDILMPGMNGYEACQRIRKAPRGESVVIVALTGRGQESDRLRSAQAGFDHHFMKPVDPAELNSLIQRLSAVRSKQKSSDAVTR